jgi:hypothetical protein
MTNTVASLTTLSLAAQMEKGQSQAPVAYRIRKGFAVVQFDLAARGRIVFLPEGAELCLIGASCLRECFEVTHENQHYNIFKVDLLGPWSLPITPPPLKPTPIKSSGIKPIGTLAALGACA